ncbi:PilN domain-containing protein [Parashewanella spongiae]|uniref:PilN domain-containing protein n=1 Tax=Parashewanella spongiae TaxID=342950 RepID=UPI001476F4E6|nr:PilN domain-containing protein [Parashewanella spongiae]MCL1078235.1 PilN domain-containing protein [Parashewanella spongiae]
MTVLTLYWQSLQVTQQLSQSKQQSIELENRQKQLEQQILAHKASNNWEVIVDKQRQLLSMKTKLLSELSQQKDVQSESYVSLLTELAETADGDSWLTHIQVNDDNLQLAGNAIEAAAVPRWLERLQATKTLSGRKFDGVKFNRDIKGALSFELIVNPSAKSELNNQL